MLLFNKVWFGHLKLRVGRHFILYLYTKSVFFLQINQRLTNHPDIPKPVLTGVKRQNWFARLPELTTSHSSGRRRGSN